MKLLAILSATVILSGCIAESKSVRGESTSTQFVNKQHNSVKVYVMDDGLECAVYNAYKEGGISCNWQKYNENLLAKSRGE